MCIKAEFPGSRIRISILRVFGHPLGHKRNRTLIVTIGFKKNHPRSQSDFKCRFLKAERSTSRDLGFIKMINEKCLKIGSVYHATHLLRCPPGYAVPVLAAPPLRGHQSHPPLRQPGPGLGGKSCSVALSVFRMQHKRELRRAGKKIFVSICQYLIPSVWKIFSTFNPLKFLPVLVFGPLNG